MFDLSDNSIASYLANPLFQATDFSHVPFSELHKEIKECYKKNAVPETDALRFYLYNHGFHLMRAQFNELSTLPDDLAYVAQTHIMSTNAIAKRMLCHTVVSTICEMDYLSTQTNQYYDQLSSAFGNSFSDFMRHIHRTNQWKDMDRLTSTCGEVTGGLVSGFAFSNWPYRKPWTRITGLSRQCVHGEISMENFADQSFSLAHWGGSILNKCHLYQCCTETLYHLLDVQDSGQIPQWIAANQSSSYVTPEIKKMYEILKKHFPEEMTRPIDKVRLQQSKKKRDLSNQQIQQAVQQAFQTGGNTNNQSKEGGRKENEIDRANQALLGFKL